MPPPNPMSVERSEPARRPGLPRLHRAGVAAVKIEGRQRGVAYIASVARVWRHAIDVQISSPQAWRVRPEWQEALSVHAEGQQTTLGPYHRAWH